VSEKYLPEDVRRWGQEEHRRKLEKRAADLRQTLSKPHPPYRRREIDCDETQRHYDEYPWMASRPISGYSKYETHPGSHCFSIELPASYLGLDEKEFVWKCQFCGALMVSDIDDVQKRPCPDEPTAIISWVHKLLEIIMALPHARCRAASSGFKAVPSPEAWIPNNLCRARGEAPSLEIGCSIRPRMPMLRCRPGAGPLRDRLSR